MKKIHLCSILFCKLESRGVTISITVLTIKIATPLFGSLSEAAELTFLQLRMDDLLVFKNREVLQQDGLKAGHLLHISLWSDFH